MHKRHGLYYDYLKEGQIREKILNEYYKEKARKIEEGRQQMKREKLKREEEFKKLKIRKQSGLKFCSLPKKPKIVITETNIANPIKQNINFNIKSSENNQNSVNVTFGNINNNSSGEQNNQNQNNENKSDNNK